MSSDSNRRGFTLVEVLVIVAIIGILVALLLPAIHSARRSARRSICSSHERQVALAVHNYIDANHDRFPALADPRSAGISAKKRGLHPDFGYIPWTYTVLPFVEQNDFHDALRDFGKWTSIVDNGEEPLAPGREGAVLEVPIYACPSDDISWDYKVLEIPHGSDFANSSARFHGISSLGYSAVAGFSDYRPEREELGAWHSLRSDEMHIRDFQERKIGSMPFEGNTRRARVAWITDGLSKTFMLLEGTPSLSGWLTSTKATVGIARNSLFRRRRRRSGFFAEHGIGNNAAFCDGSVRYLTADIDPEVFESFVTRAGGETPSGSR